MVPDRSRRAQERLYPTAAFILSVVEGSKHPRDLKSQIASSQSLSPNLQSKISNLKSLWHIAGGKFEFFAIRRWKISSSGAWKCSAVREVSAR